jgi:N-acetylmuramoyl-L-alanine amidase
MNHVSVAWQPPGESRTLIPPSAYSHHLPSLVDAEDDYLPNTWESIFGLNPTLNGRTDRRQAQDGDHDRDTLSNLREYQLGTNPTNPDTDGDGLRDDFEVHSPLDPSNPTSISGVPDGWLVTYFPELLTSGLQNFNPTDDLDGDGLSTLQEADLGTNPNNVDSDGDGQNDNVDSAPVDRAEYGLVNPSFDATPTENPIRRWPATGPATASLYPHESIPGWHAHTNNVIELRHETATDNIVELHAHWPNDDTKTDTGHGVTQSFQMLPGTTRTYILRYKGRASTATVTADNEFSLKLTGGTLKVDGTAVTTGEKSYTGTVDEFKYSVIEFSVPAGSAEPGQAPAQALTLEITPSKSADSNTYGAWVDLLPVEIVELAPKLRDESDAEIVGSEKPAVAPKSTEMVERDPSATPTPLNDASAIRIAWRDMKVKIGAPMTGKKVTWSMTPQFTPLQSDGSPEAAPRFRGKWGTAANTFHRHRFSASEKYGVNGYESIAQILETETSANVTTVAQTTVDADGYTAIRVNVPPIGFNRARIRIQIEGTAAPIDLIDMEVPAVIVIDPGHGTGPTQPGSNAIGGEADDSGELEHAFALDLAQRTRTEIRDHEEAQRRNIRVFLTRENTTNISAAARTKVARDNGCDVYMSIHFNDSTSRQHRDPFGMWDSTGNLNLEEDQALAIRLRQAVQAAIAEVEPAESRDANRSDYDSEHWESVLQKGLDTCSDLQGGAPYNGNVPGYTPCRAALIEIEWMSHSAADALFNTNPPMEQMRAATAERLAGACIQDVMVQPETN